MKRLSPALPVIIAIGFVITGFLVTQRPFPDTCPGGEMETDEPAALMREEFLKTRDPKTNQVPVERLYNALSYYRAHEAAAAVAKTTGINFSAIVWAERGPNNVGGRTRSIIFDKNDATNKRVFAGSVGGGLWRCNDISATPPVWTPVDDHFASLAVTTIAQDPGNPQIMYFGTGEGFYNGDAIRGGGIWQSTNGGTTWTRLTTTAGNQDFSYVQKIIVNAQGDVYAACRGYFCNNAGGLLKSSNSGTSFTRVIGTTAGSCGASADLSFSDVEEAANGDLYATAGLFTTGKIYKSSAATHGANVGNAGTWVNVTPPAAVGLFNRIELGVAPGNANRVYALFHDPSTNNCSAIYTTTNGGTSWSSVAVPTIIDQGNNSNFSRGQAWYDLVCSVDPNNDQTVYIGGVDLLKSTNAGTSWTQITTWSLFAAPLFTAAQNIHADQHSLVFSPGSSAIAVAVNDGGVFYSTNLNVGVGLPAWSQKNNGYNVTQFYSCAPHPTNIDYFIGGTQDNGTPRFNSAGVNATVDVIGGDGAFSFVSKTNGSNQIGSYVNNFFYRSTNGGASFSALSGSNNTGLFINPADLDHAADILYSAGNNNQLVRWSNVFAGVSRTNLTVSIGGTQATAVSVSPNIANRVYVGTNAGNIYRISNANAAPTVTQIASGLGGGNYINSIDVWKSTSGTDDSMVVALSNYGINSVYYTANGSAAVPTWTDIDDNNTLQDVPVRWAVFAPNYSAGIFLATEVGVMATDNISGNATAWTLVNNGNLPMVSTHMLKHTSNGNLVAATHGRGLFTSSNTVPLSLRLLSFRAVHRESHVDLEWQVANNELAREYAVERMYKGEGAFSNIATLEPRASQSRYSTTDGTFDPRKEVALYRLKCMDRSGQTLYSAVRQVSVLTEASSPFITAVYPTNTNGPVQIATATSTNDRMLVMIVNSAGTVVKNEFLPTRNQTLDFGSYPPGVYVLHLVSANGVDQYNTRILKR